MPNEYNDIGCVIAGNKLLAADAHFNTNTSGWEQSGEEERRVTAVWYDLDGEGDVAALAHTKIHNRTVTACTKHLAIAQARVWSSRNGYALEIPELPSSGIAETYYSIYQAATEAIQGFVQTSNVPHKIFAIDSREHAKKRAVDTLISGLRATAIYEFSQSMAKRLHDLHVASYNEGAGQKALSPSSLRYFIDFIGHTKIKKPVLMLNTSGEVQAVWRSSKSKKIAVTFEVSSTAKIVALNQTGFYPKKNLSLSTRIDINSISRIIEEFGLTSVVFE